MTRAFVGSTTINHQYLTELGVTFNPTTVTCTAVADDGTTVTLGTQSNAVVGTFQRLMTVLAPTRVLVTWTADGVPFVDLINVQSAPVITVAELLAAEPALGSKVSMPALLDAIEDAEAECTAITGVAWRRRYEVAVLPVTDGRVRLPWPYVTRVGRVTVETVTQQAGSWLLRANGLLDVPARLGQNVEIGFEHGLIEPHREIRRAVLIRARQIAQTPTSSVSQFTERVQVGDAVTTVRMMPGALKTGVAEVDAAYARHRWPGRVA